MRAAECDQTAIHLIQAAQSVAATPDQAGNIAIFTGAGEGALSAAATDGERGHSQVVVRRKTETNKYRACVFISQKMEQRFAPSLQHC